MTDADGIALHKASRWQSLYPVGFAALVTCVCGIALYASLPLVPLSIRYFPLAAALLGVVLGSYLTAVEILSYRRNKALAKPETRARAQFEVEADEDERPFRYELYFVMSLIVYTISVMLFGYFPSSALFLIALLKVGARLSWLMTAISTAACLGVIAIAGELLELRWP